MITIIEHGKTRFEKTCSRCGCKFSYELEDLYHADTIYCPECNNKLYHSLSPIKTNISDFMEIRYDNYQEETT